MYYYQININFLHEELKYSFNEKTVVDRFSSNFHTLHIYKMTAKPLYSFPKYHIHLFLDLDVLVSQKYSKNCATVFLHQEFYFRAQVSYSCACQVGYNLNWKSAFICEFK